MAQLFHGNCIEEMKQLDPNASYVSDEPSGFKTNADKIRGLQSEVYNLNK